MPDIKKLADEAVELLKRFGTIKAVADHLGCPPTTISYRLKRAKALGLYDGGHVNPRNSGQCTSMPQDEGTTAKECNGRLDVQVVSSTICTKEQALAECDIDPAVWYEDSYQFRAYQTIRREDTAPQQLRSFAFRFKRRVSEAEQQAAEGLLERIRQHAPKYPKARQRRKLDSPYAVEFSPFDAHFGKLAWHRETGENYDLEIAERLFSSALEYTLAVLPPGNCEQFIFPVGSDFFHVDSLDAKTTAGTPQDTDGRFGKIYETGMMACVRAIDRMLELAPVRVVWVPGNHDWLASFHLANFLHAWYRNCSDVTVDKGPSPRKYVRYGVSLIGFTHGNEEKHAALPAIMATEQPEAWAKTTRHEWHLGHHHRRRATQHTAVDSYEGVTVRTLPSLSGRDAWHHKKGYIGNRAAESYIWSKTNGYLGHIEAPVEAL